ncbi:hypothetical protein QTP86_023060, partial [Hemibagrus guttatus]
MLPALCSLFTALSCVSGVTVVTQKPPVLTLTPGQTATMDCNLGTVTGSAARWYKQVPGGVPQYVLRNYHEWSAPEYGSGFSSPKFTSTHSSESDYKLIISNVEVGDSAVYYCNTWDSSAKETEVETMWTVTGVSGVTVVTQKPPVLTLTPGQTATMDCNLETVKNYEGCEELKSKKATLVCLASDMSVGFADVRWLVNGNSVTSGVITGPVQQQDNKKFTLSSYLTIDSCEWDNDKVITCEVSAGGKPASVKINNTSLQSLLYLLVTPLISSLSTRVPSHTDTMLPALCSLFTALSCVSGVTVVTQKPPVLTLTPGQTATMDCNLGTVKNSARWYKQDAEEVPQFVIIHYESWSSPKYGAGFSSPKFTSTCSTPSD